MYYIICMPITKETELGVRCVCSFTLIQLYCNTLLLYGCVKAYADERSRAISRAARRAPQGPYLHTGHGRARGRETEIRVCVYTLQLNLLRRHLLTVVERSQTALGVN